MGTRFAESAEEVPSLLRDNDISLDGMNKGEEDRFFTSIIFENGGLAHFRYEDVKHHLSDHDFNRLLIVIGTNKDNFNDFRDKYCGGSIEANGCLVSSGDYCDPSFCRSILPLYHE